MRAAAVIALCLLLASAQCNAKGHGLRMRPRIPEDVKFASGIHNNFILGHYRKVMNWTMETLGKDPKDILKHCSSPSAEGPKVCAEVPMPTPWTTEMDHHHPLPEYPRPQLQRTRWQNLNGIWNLKTRGVQEMSDKLDSWSKIQARPVVVPYPVEAYLSGVVKHDVNNINLHYTKKFTVPKEWASQRLILHLDAVDHQTTVYVNGNKAGSHVGGYDRFSFDITEFLKDGENELTVVAFDPTEFAHIPIGKQRLHVPRHPSSIWYTSTSGIWQTVWLEPVPEAYITRLELIPNIDEETISVLVHGSKAAKDAPFRAEVTASGSSITAAKGKVGKQLVISIPKPKLWSPESPFLYDLEITLEADSPHAVVDFSTSSTKKIEETSGRQLKGLDSFMDVLFGKQKNKGHKLKSPQAGGGRDGVTSYFGMRKSSMGKTPDGALRPMLNNEFVFQTGMLDQGFWPDGLYTPASDKALIWDLEFTKEMGYNMLRKHTKVESDRWYYHADRLGVLVWQDMPSMFFQTGEQDLSAQDKANYKQELTNLIEQHFNFPSIITWVIFNEGWGQHDTVDVVKYAMSLDSSRVFDGASGWVDQDVGNLIDMHQYVGPGSPVPTPTRAAVLGEFGGLGRRIEGHMFVPDDAFAYQMHSTAKELEDHLTQLYTTCGNLMEDPRFYLSASVYTELTDVEAEINGWVTYDRMVKKINTKVLREANERLIARSRALNKAGAVAMPFTDTDRQVALSKSKNKGKAAGKT